MVTRISRICYGRGRIEVFGELPQEIVIAVQVDANTIRIAAAIGRGPAVFSPLRSLSHAVVAAIRVSLWEDIHVLLIYDALNLCGGELLPPERDAGFCTIGFAKLLGKIDEDIGTAPFSSVNS